ncbi:uncharacterized protein LOC122502380 [Leptopilina heterotoma]|uniref:uncharacterized protein LOC122502380 n=1 Tax=Leptopilina heterotoma TaxID=63436 RepID=UPI001CA7F14C|nr:uncharacterized protein LOC122502380 [Leptopilina heterotoma]
MDVSKIKENWLDGLKRITNLLVEDEEFENLNSNEQALILLESLPKLLPSKKPTDKTIFKVYERGTAIEETIPPADCEPYLIGIGNPEETDIVLMSYSDGEPIFVVTASEAVPLLLASFWVFNITFPHDIQRQFSLLSIIIFREKSTKLLTKEMLSYTTVKNLLEKAGLRKPSETN